MLTPMDIEQKEFRKAIRGYHIGDVEDFLAELSESYETLYLEHQAAKEQIAMLSDAVAQYKSMEETLRTALAVARRDGEDMKRAAKAEAEDLARETKVQAEEEISRLSYQYEQMKHSVEIFRAKVVSLLHAQLDIIKEYGEVEAEMELYPQPEPEQTTAVLDEIPKDAVSAEEQNTVEIPVVVTSEE